MAEPFSKQALAGRTIRMITIDLDGTALQNDHQSFSLRLHHALDEAVRCGIAVIPITGRQIAGLPQALQDHHDWNSIAVTANGAMVHDLRTGRVLSIHPFDPDQLKHLAMEAEKAHLILEAGTGLHDYLSTSDYERELNEPSLSFHVGYILKRLGEVHETLDFTKISDPIIKVNVIATNDAEHDLAAELLSEFPFHTTETNRNFFEIGSTGVSKASGLAEACRMLQIDVKDCMSFGDSENDRSILMASGCSIAMGNAPQGLKEACDFVTDTNVNDGVAKVVEQVIACQAK